MDADDHAEPVHCPTCGTELVNGARYTLADPIAVDTRVEVRTNAGGRIGYFVGYLADGRLEVFIDGQRFVFAADKVTPLPDYLQPKGKEAR